MTLLWRLPYSRFSICITMKVNRMEVNIMEYMIAGAVIGFIIGRLLRKIHG